MSSMCRTEKNADYAEKNAIYPKAEKKKIFYGKLISYLRYYHRISEEEDGGRMKAASIYWMNTKKLENEACFLKYYEILSPARRKKVDSCLQLKDKRLSLATGILLDRGLAAYGLCERNAAVVYGENGKPRLPQYPHIHFSLSHSGNRAMAVFADVETGCDIEKMQKANMKLAEKFFTLKEYTYIEEQGTAEKQDEAFCRLWTLKESFVKVIGDCSVLPRDSFEVTISPNERIRVSQNIDNASYYFEEYRLEGYFAAVCFRRERAYG